MSAVLGIRKYVGKDDCFGMPVSSIGLKRVDNVVPAVYGSPVVPADDASDVNTYYLIKPEGNETVYSYESIFKLVLNVPPSNQLTNIKIYPKSSESSDIYIGCSKYYTKPTNNLSLVATQRLSTFSKTNPFLVTVGGMSGMTYVDRLNVTTWNISYGDVGFGNVIYLNDLRQPEVPLTKNTAITFVNHLYPQIDFKIYDFNTDLEITSTNINVITHSDIQTITITPDEAFMNLYPSGFKYGTSDMTGGFISWLNFDVEQTTVVIDVSVVQMPNGNYVYMMNGERNPILNFEPNTTYIFNNTVGDMFPLRFLNNRESQTAGERDIVIKGIEVTDGGTVDEVIKVDVNKVKQYGSIKSYQSVSTCCMGNDVNMRNICYVGAYNLNRVNAGNGNPLSAGETDFIYLQCRVNNSTDPQTIVPDLVIEWDEN